MDLLISPFKIDTLMHTHFCDSFEMFNALKKRNKRSWLDIVIISECVIVEISGGI